MRRRFEIASTGVDEGLQGLSSSPISLGLAQGPGLRVPSLVPAAAPNVLGRYLFCLATRQLAGPTRITGLRQLVTIGASLPTNIGIDGGVPPPTRPVELNVTSPSFRFPDGNISWHLVLEPNTRPRGNVPLTDAANFVSTPGSGAALLYQPGQVTWAAAQFDPFTGSPLYYNVGLLTYQPPPIWNDWKDIGGLGTFYDLRFQWAGDHAWDTLDICIGDTGSNMRVSFYASVLQTGVQTGLGGGDVAAFPSNGVAAPNQQPLVYDTPEEGFIQTILVNTAASSIPVLYWRVGGAIIFEDESECDAPAKGVFAVGAGACDDEPTKEGA